MHPSDSQDPLSPLGRKKADGQTTSSHNQSLSSDAESGDGAQAKPKVDPQNPHERDESSHSQARESEDQKLIGEQAYRDAVSPVEDTDRGPVLDEVYNDKVAPDRGQGAQRR